VSFSYIISSVLGIEDSSKARWTGLRITHDDNLSEQFSEDFILIKYMLPRKVDNKGGVSVGDKGACI
jgi:hypothetical protein